MIFGRIGSPSGAPEHFLEAFRVIDFDRDIAPQRSAVRSYCYRLLGTLSDADDAAQEALVRAWKARERFEGRSSVKTCHRAAELSSFASRKPSMAKKVFIRSTAPNMNGYRCGAAVCTLSSTYVSTIALTVSAAPSATRLPL